jgi:hypothetical protein
VTPLPAAPAVISSDKDNLISALQAQVTALQAQIVQLKSATGDFTEAVAAYQKEITQLHIQIAALQSATNPWEVLARYGTGGTEAITITITRSWHALTGGAMAVRHSVGNGQTSTDIALVGGVHF